MCLLFAQLRRLGEQFVLIQFDIAGAAQEMGTTGSPTKRGALK